jgi:hypothetical protein
MTKTTWTKEEVIEIAYQAAGAGTAPFMKELPDYVMPTEDVSAGVRSVLKSFGIEE